MGRIVVALLDDVKVGAQRFADLAEEKEGVGYRLSKFDGIFSVSVAAGPVVRRCGSSKTFRASGPCRSVVARLGRLRHGSLPLAAGLDHQ